MRTDCIHLNQFRNRSHPQFKSEDSDGMNGFFVIPVAQDTWALTLASCGNEIVPWDHVSARIGVKKYHGKMVERCPSWDEMCLLKDIFWDDTECVMQLHPKAADYVNHHPFVLHLWKPHNLEIPMPPKISV